MTFAEKLERLINGRDRAEIARLIDVAPTVLSNYLNRGTMPRVDIALRLSKLFGCSLSWLVDDQRTWESPEKSLAVDLAARYVAIAHELRNMLQEASKIDWAKIAKAINRGPDHAPLAHDAPLPSEFKRELEIARSLRHAGQSLLQFNVCGSPQSFGVANDLPHKGADLQAWRILKEVDEIIKNDAGFSAVTIAIVARETSGAAETVQASANLASEMERQIKEMWGFFQQEISKLGTRSSRKPR